MPFLRNTSYFTNLVIKQLLLTVAPGRKACTHVHRLLGDMTRDVTRYLFLAKREMTRHITGDETRYSIYF